MKHASVAGIGSRSERGFYMKDQDESLLVVRSKARLTLEQMNNIQSRLTPIAEKMGITPLVVDEGLDVGVHSDIRPLLEEQLVEQRQTNQLLIMLIESLSEEDIARSDEPLRYTDGIPV